MSDKVLFVDDEPAILDGYKRMLGREFTIETANSGELGVTAIKDRGPYALIISDMRMPGMDGVQFLSHAMQLAPDTVRMVLTGYADIESAMSVVNEGNIFRFLTKPCPKEVLAKAITTGLMQHRLITAEKELLENTLMGSIKVLTEVLSLSNPSAFGRSVRITHCVRHLVRKFNLKSAWRFEAAAMLSQLGWVSFDPDLMEATATGTVLCPEDQARIDAHPKVARDLLINIPRLEPIAWMISQQSPRNKPTGQVLENCDLSADALLFGAELLRVSVAFDDLVTKGMSQHEAIGRLRQQPALFNPDVVKALCDLTLDSPGLQPRVIPVSQLRPGMILDQDIRNRAGVLVVSKGWEVNDLIIARLDSLLQHRAIDPKVMVLAPILHM